MTRRFLKTTREGPETTREIWPDMTAKDPRRPGREISRRPRQTTTDQRRARRVADLPLPPRDFAATGAPDFPTARAALARRTSAVATARGPELLVLRTPGFTP
jgi:hypothetical protein